PLNLSRVNLKIIGLNCSCHLSKIHGALKKIPGVAFISTPPKKPFAATVLLDQSLTTTGEMLAQCNNDALLTELDSAGSSVKVKLEITSEEPVKSISAALEIARAIRFGPILSFQKTYSDYINRFQDVVPIMPVDDHDTIHGVESAANWNASI